MRGVTWAAAAIEDLRAIQAYLGEHDAAAVQDVVDRIIRSAVWLRDLPNAGSPIVYRRWRKWSARKTAYLLIYRPTATGIEIVHVRHERTDWQRAVE